MPTGSLEDRDITLEYTRETVLHHLEVVANLEVLKGATYRIVASRGTQ